jgi:predicted DNA-binding transcriptional regulator AlpA
MSATKIEQIDEPKHRRYLKNVQPARYLTAKQASDYTGIGLSTLSIYRTRGEGPAYVQWGANVRYDIAVLDAWMASNQVIPEPKPATQKRHGRPKKAAR